MHEQNYRKLNVVVVVVVLLSPVGVVKHVVC